MLLFSLIIRNNFVSASLYCIIFFIINIDDGTALNKRAYFHFEDFFSNSGWFL
jgi:hypothetical protein